MQHIKSSIRRPRGRPPAKQSHIVADLRRQIVDGELPPDARLETRRELSDSYGVSLVTVQHALQQLARDGFVEARGKKGTFVVSNPPHLCRYAVVFPSRPASYGQDWPRSWQALVNEAPAFSIPGSRDVALEYNVQPRTDSPEYRDFVKQVQRCRVAGILFAGPPFGLEQSPVVTRPGIARVALMSKPEARYPDVAAVMFDYDAFFEKAVDDLAHRGHKRVALLLPPGLEQAHADLETQIKDRGMTCPAYWRLSVHQSSPGCAENIVHLLVRNAQRDRPDALIIANDHLVAHACRGLAAAGVAVGSDIDVVAHWNFPAASAAPVPIRRLGFDIRDLLSRSFDIMDRQQAGDDWPAMTHIPPVWEADVSSSATEVAPHDDVW